MNKHFKMVREFHETFKQTQADEPTLIDKKEATLRYTLGTEEVDEYIEAIAQDDLIEVLDSLADQMYILIGTIHKHGLHNVFDKAFELVHQNNMRKLGPDGNPILREDGKIMKPENFEKVKLKTVLTL